MAIEEISERELKKVINEQTGKAAVFFFTPFCGTCKLAEKMLEIIQSTSISTVIHKVNINYAPLLRDDWKITSVPCLVILQDGVPMHFEYALRSVDHVYGMLK
ncbi:thioredoxin family protein [Paenibacillus abyssi]|uniref:Thioredoxin-like protein YusE n=1 Tax=Paenibacillus abyssi TaxID=1340531 RepID=A0A917D7N7_9BACL|nr:thioredoxin family protein [Paenibacillus abyssi]GGG13288.1 thioredoxin-like protein YusE [Paenibacillus abyssi]